MTMPGKPRIRVLPDDMINKIAAGEVIERPASVVKELVENAIDAGATHIVVEIEQAGKQLIRVTDDGEGMSAEEAQLAFQRHATSKIGAPEDLERIGTLGFRGEALPSIAAVARVRLSACADANAAGTEVVIEGGKVMEVRAVAHPRGATMEARDLFFNVPARKKFLKGDATEAAHITQVVTQQALARPGIHFTLSHNGRRILNVLPAAHMLYRIAEIMGPELSRELIRVREQNGMYSIEGYISSPAAASGSRHAQYFFVNGRHIRDKVILSATQKGYSHTLPRDQHPALFLFLRMDPALVDINVHPAKAEARFAMQSEVYHFVSSSVRQALVKNERDGADTAEPAPPPADDMAVAPPRSGSPAAMPWAAQAPAARAPGAALDLFHSPALEAEGGGLARTQFEMFERRPVALTTLIYSEFEPVGQLNNSFIILQGARGVVLVDQHIAHERVLYEKFSRAARQRKIEVQQLLFPVAVEFSPADAQILTAHFDLLRELGLDLEIFGANGFLLRAVPAILKDDDFQDLLRRVVEELRHFRKTDAVAGRYEELLITLACRDAIKVNHPLHMDQIRALLYDLEQTEMPYTCPHGRPIAILIEMDDILRKFLRK